MASPCQSICSYRNWVSCRPQVLQRIPQTLQGISLHWLLSILLVTLTPPPARAVFVTKAASLVQLSWQRAAPTLWWPLLGSCPQAECLLGGWIPALSPAQGPVLAQPYLTLSNSSFIKCQKDLTCNSLARFTWPGLSECVLTVYILCASLALP